MAIHSPLRYPGGKAKFAKLIQPCLEGLVNQETIFVEPFCGGAGVALTLLAGGGVQRISLNDIDPIVAAFWKVVFGHTEKSKPAQKSDLTWLINRIENADLSVNGWLTQKKLEPTSDRAAAFKCLYLNRTSFNGILHKAGPIGGWSQVNRTLDVRFNKCELVKRILALWELRDSVTSVTNVSWQEVFANFRGKNCFIYMDPPYYHRAEQLYGYLFDEARHTEMRDLLKSEDKTPWLLSYDDAPEVRALYAGQQNISGLVIDRTYSTHPLGGGRFIGRELFFSNRALAGSNRSTEAEHSAVSIVGPIAQVASSVEGPVRTPLLGNVLTRQRAASLLA